MGNPNWETPPPFFERVSAAWGPFELDAAASEANAKCDLLFDEEMNALALESWLTKEYRCRGGWVSPVWKPSRAFCNPPYTNLAVWVRKAAEESDKGLTVVMLLPWGQWAEWMEVAGRRAEIVRVVGRIKFIDPDPPKGKPRTCPNGMNIIAVFRPPVEGVTWPVGFAGGSVRA